ncbi:alpha-(1-_3)-arabinofuranosyltransferase domain-containing protein [Nocardioides flavescens]|uniref:DUF3367 domain-containing protein n=1 Tax=Nocardioides flavescens TaxID=2691959 RepID=A0A6L7EWG6_9ACTN|nr:alpha-(1->3)-arabinofuranosyltransferase family protein [Nocardioides flavescens]MXG88535.1 DUF3367 domain-containing protein [Nocardioides flavescens]
MTATESSALRGNGRTRFRLAAACVVLLAVALVQEPGLLVPDTKFDLVAAPGEFLRRALHLWDAEGAFGQLQNQAYGYLWPMGPLFWVGDLVDLPGWLVQRLWLSLVLVVAFLGAALLVRALGVRSDLATVLAGLAFALSPRMLTTLGPISIEAWPGALAPWVLLALVRGSECGSPRRWAAIAGLAVGAVGGVNAAATFAVVPLGVVWLLTRTPGPRRRALMLWWPVFTLLATGWWLVPLFVMGTYSPPFLDYIETSSVTTLPTTVWDVLRGTSNWVPYVDASSRAGNDLITTPYLVLDSAVVLAVGVIGLLDRRTPQRAFLGLSVLLGVLMVGAGHQGSTAGWFSGDLSALLDGALSPLRNVHKFDPVVRLPLVIGLAFFVDRTRSGERRTRPVAERVNSMVLAGVVVLAVAGASVPAVVGRIAPAGGFAAVPAYWQQTASWLAREADGTTLVVPGTSFGTYVWGDPRDEPMQYLATSPWAVRNVIPLAPPGGIRMLDAFEDRLAQGEGSPGLASALARAGVEHVVVRNDLERGSDVPDPVLVHQALVQSGLERVADFGPTVGGDAVLASGTSADPATGGSADAVEAGSGGPTAPRVLANDGWQAPYPAVEVYAVPERAATAVSAAEVAVVAGGPEDLLDLQDLGVLDDRPAVLAGDLDPELVDALGVGPGRVVLTDGLRDRERFFARIHDGASAALTSGDTPQTGNPTRDYLVPGADRWSTRVQLTGARRIVASSSRSSAVALGGAVRGDLPYAAVDGDPDTQWVSGAGRTDRASWRVDLTDPRDVDEVELRGGADAADNQQVEVVTQAGTSGAVDLPSGTTRRVPVPAGTTGWVEVRDASPDGGRQLALADVGVDGLQVERALRLPSLPESWGDPAAVVLRADLDDRRGCVDVGGDVRCATGRDQAAEESSGIDRVVPLASADSFGTDLLVRPRAGAALDDLTLASQPVSIAASSLAVPDPRAGPVSAVDGNRSSTWYAATDDLRPSLDVRWLGSKRISGIKIGLDRDASARRPLRVRIDSGDQTRVVALDERGRASFRPLVTSAVSVQVLQADVTQSLDFAAQARPIGIGVSTLRLRGLDYLPLGLSADRRDLGCGSGPDLLVDETARLTAVQAAPSELLAGREVPARVCAGGAVVGDPAPTVSSAVELPAGDVRIVSRPDGAFETASLVLSSRSATGPAAADTTAAELATGPDSRTVRPGDDAAVVVLRQNVNAGWQATQGGRRLLPVTVDGWQQGWVLPGGDTAGASVRARFAPDTAYRWGLLLGLCALFALAAGVGWSLRRRRGRPDGPPPVSERRLPVVVAGPVALVGGGLVAGWPGLLVAAGVVAVVGLGTALGRLSPAYVSLRGPWRELMPWLCAAPCLLAGAAYAVRPWGGASGWAGASAWPSYLALVPLLAVVVVAGWDDLATRAERRRSSQRSTGRSTTR